MLKQKRFVVNIFKNKKNRSIKSAADINFLSLLTRIESFDSYTNTLRKKKLKGKLKCRKWDADLIEVKNKEECYKRGIV